MRYIILIIRNKEDLIEINEREYANNRNRINGNLYTSTMFW